MDVVLALSPAVIAMRTVQWLFFIGLGGCAIVVAISWVSVVKGCLTDEE